MFLRKTNPNDQRKECFAVAALSAAVFYFLVNGYRFFNPLFSGDALLMIYQNDAAWQIALGRVGQPFLVLLRGGITSPFLISVLAMLWTALAAAFTADLLKLRSRSSILAVSAVMGSHGSMIAANANFLPWVDFYAFALFLAVCGVWMIRRGKVRTLLAGTGMLAFCMSIYQAYICVAIGLFMILLLLRLQKETAWKDFLKESLTAAGTLLAGAVLYVLFWKVIQKSLHIWTADSYNGLASVGDYSGQSVLSILALTYRNVAEHFWNPQRFLTMTFREHDLSILWVWLLRIVSLFMLALLLFFQLRGERREKTARWQPAIRVVLLALFPLGINFVCFLSQGMEHSLMVYAFCLVPVLTVVLLERGADAMPSGRKWAVLCFLIGIPLWSNLVYANQVYLKKQAQEEAAKSLMTRLEYSIESMEGYIPGVTPVAFTGSFETSPYVEELTAFSGLLPWGTAQTALSYIGTDYAYLGYFESLAMNLTRVDTADARIRSLPSYPQEGSVAYVDGILVVKISD